MIELKLHLKDASELLKLQTALDEIYTAREAADAAFYAKSYDDGIEAREVAAPQLDQSNSTFVTVDELRAQGIRPGETFTTGPGVVLAQADGAPAEPAFNAPVEVTEADTIAALTALIKNAGVPKAIEVLGEFGVKRVTELAPETRAAFIAKAAA